ncbi:MAG: ABC transporter ATP-binding protein [Thermoleophilia bacterium]
MSEPAPRIEARGLTLDLGSTPVLADLSLTLDPGEMVALVGPSGCGKSTLLSVLAGLLPPDAGEVRIDGRTTSAGGRLGRLTLMPQSDALLPWRTLEANVAMAPALAGVPRGEARALARRALARYGLAGFERHYPHALSGGMRQRAALARTLLGGARAWLLDEPFGALDALTRSDLQGVLAGAWEQERPTALLVTHDLDEALRLADRVLVCSPRPARVIGEVAVGAPRPERRRDAGWPEGVELRARLLATLRGAGVAA